MMQNVKTRTRTTGSYVTRRWDIGNEQPQLRRAVTVSAPVTGETIRLTRRPTYVYTRIGRSMLKRGGRTE